MSQYDGFGNLTAKALNETPTTIAVNAATNRLSNANYDLNGNMTSGFGASFGYDTSNRMASSQAVSGGMEHYGYAPDNKRVFRQLANGSQQVTLYGVRGEKLYTFDPTGTVPGGATYVWFGGKLIFDGNGGPVYQDRLGSNRAGAGPYRPYGEEYTTTQNDHVKFGTYTRDSYTGLDYADQRFYASTYGRFITPDPYAASGGPSEPGSWNRYSYVLGDPINNKDPNGTCAESTTTSVTVCDSFSLLDLQPAIVFPGQTGAGGGWGTAAYFNTVIRSALPSVAAQFAPINFQPTLTDAMKLVDGALKTASCQGLFGTAATRSNGFDPAKIADQLYGNGGSTVAVGNTTVSATFVSAGPLLPYGLTVGSSLLPTVGVGVAIKASKLNNDSFETAITLLHELGHVYNDISGSGGSPISKGLLDLTGANDDQIVQSCLINKPTR